MESRREGGRKGDEELERERVVKEEREETEGGGSLICVCVCECTHSNKHERQMESGGEGGVREEEVDGTTRAHQSASQQ